MIDRFDKNDLLNLVQRQNDPCVTIYLLTEKTGREIHKAATRLRQLVKTACQSLAGHWMSDSDAETFLRPLTELSEDAAFWEVTDHGLALFLDANGLQRWRVATTFAEQVFVSDRFFIRPLVATANNHQAFYILALSQNKTQLFAADETSLKTIAVPEMPASLKDSLNLTSVDRGLQIHTGSREHKGKQAGVFHGQGKNGILEGRLAVLLSPG